MFVWPGIDLNLDNNLQSHFSWNNWRSDFIPARWNSTLKNNSGIFLPNNISIDKDETSWNLDFLQCTSWFLYTHICVYTYFYFCMCTYFNYKQRLRSAVISIESIFRKTNATRAETWWRTLRRTKSHLYKVDITNEVMCVYVCMYALIQCQRRELCLWAPRYFGMTHSNFLSCRKPSFSYRWWTNVWPTIKVCKGAYTPTCALIIFYYSPLGYLNFLYVD